MKISFFVLFWEPSPGLDENGLDASDSPEKEDEINESVRWRIESDNDANTQLKPSKSRLKLNRMSKILTEQNQPMNRKTRRTLESSSLLDLNKKKKNNEPSHADSLSMQLVWSFRASLQSNSFDFRLLQFVMKIFRRFSKIRSLPPNN